MAKKSYVTSSVVPETVRMAAKPSAEALIKTKPGEKCVYFGDIVPSKEFTATCKASEMEASIKALCGTKKYSIARVKELVGGELAIRVRLAEAGPETLIS